MDWGQGLCGERLPDHRDFSSAIDEATVQQLGAPNDSTAEAREPEPVMTSTINNDISSSSANSIDHAQPLQLPRFLRGAQLRLTSVACGSGHVIAAVGGGGVISWGGAALGSSGELGEQRVWKVGRVKHHAFIYEYMLNLLLSFVIPFSVNLFFLSSARHAFFSWQTTKRQYILKPPSLLTVILASSSGLSWLPRASMLSLPSHCQRHFKESSAERRGYK